MVKVNVKWNKQVFPDVELDPSDSVETFKTQLWTLTGVPLERQKLMSKGGWKGILKDDADLSKCTVTDGLQIMLMGSADVVEKPKEKVVFMEDLKDDALATSGAVLPAGLVNLGNTCYMNSTLQCLRKVPELRTALTGFKPPASEPSQEFTTALRDTLDTLDKSLDPVPPMMFVHRLRTLHPQFAQQGPRGGFMQQDAEELYSALLNTLALNLKDLPKTPATITEGETVMYMGSEGKREEAVVAKVHRDDATPYYTIKVNGAEKQTDAAHLDKIGSSFDLEGARSVVDALFGIEVEEKMECTEEGAKEEPKRTSRDRQFKLVCNIQGGAGATVQVAHLHEGVKVGLTNQVTMHSETLGRDAVWNKTQRIAKLPRYLCVQFMRFFWKATPDSQDHAGVKCKIMKPVSFPNILDTYDFCTEELQKVLAIPRAKVDADILAKEKAKEASTATGESEAKKHKVDDDGGKEESKEESKPAPEPMEVEAAGDGEEDEALKAALAMSMGTEVAPTSTPAGAAGPGLPADFKGNYELFAVVTHKGREADGGHYMGWVRQGGDDWLVFDDADVSPCKTEDIMKLNGGGDWHMAYLTFYRYKD
eukprot:TRINITY_DN22822_c0_g1_i1.p1 TRINITY_DN22822_c0_g1~~TRINITY_DN22822_c0_g1_i1.p1  ORF type:complete len:617 (-),score=235.18 TRINITY_DN22822_c0_g1_i1:454-2232(-)